MTSFWFLALHNLKRNKRRNLATVTAVAFGYAGLLMMEGFVAHSENLLRINSVYLQHIGHLAIFKGKDPDAHQVKPEKYSFTPEERQSILEVLELNPNVEFSGSYLQTTGLVGNGCRSIPFVGTGVDPGVERKIRKHPAVKTYLGNFSGITSGKGIWEPSAPENAIVLCDGLARLLGKHNLDFSAPPFLFTALPDCSDPVATKTLNQDTNVQLAGGTFSGSFSAVDAEVTGIFSTGNSETNSVELLTSTKLLQQLLDTSAVTYIAAFLKNTDNIEAKAESLEATLRERNLKVSVLTFRDDRINQFYTGTVDFLLSMVSFIGSVTGLVVVLSIANSMTMSVIERSREIGSLRALGFRRSHILGIFLREAALIATLGIVLGALVAWAAASGINAMNWQFKPPSVPSEVQFMIVPTLVPSLAIGVALFALVMLGALVAVKKKSYENIVNLMTHVAA